MYPNIISYIFFCASYYYIKFKENGEMMGRGISTHANSQKANIFPPALIIHPKPFLIPESNHSLLN